MATVWITPMTSLCDIYKCSMFSPHSPILLTCSSSSMRAERSLSSCCRSSSISLLSSSPFSSSSASGEPIPSSFSSARLLLGDEPLNSYRTNIRASCITMNVYTLVCTSLIEGDKTRYRYSFNIWSI